VKDKYEWKERAHCWYYYNTTTGKIIGKTNKIALSDVCIALVYTGKYTFTIEDEKHLGEYIDLEFAKKAVENYWDVEYRTLLAGPQP
jgi:hypothetical protein